MADLPDDLQPVSETPAPSAAPKIPDDLQAVPDDLQPVSAPAWQAKFGEHLQQMKAAGMHPQADPAEYGKLADVFRQKFGTPEEAAQPNWDEKQVQAHQQAVSQNRESHGLVASNLLNAAQPLEQAGGSLEKLLAKPVGLVAPGLAAGMQEQGQAAQEGGGSTAGITTGKGLLNLPGQLIGQATKYANPVVAGLMGASQATQDVEDQKAAGQRIGGGAEALNIGGHALLDATVSKMFNMIPGGPQGVLQLGEQGVSKLLAKMAPDVLAKYGAKGIINAAVMVNQNLASNQLNKSTINPNQDVNAGTLESAAQGLGLSLAHGAVETAFSRARGQVNPSVGENLTPTAEEATSVTPSASPEQTIPLKEGEQNAATSPQVQADSTAIDAAEKAGTITPATSIPDDVVPIADENAKPVNPLLSDLRAKQGELAERPKPVRPASPEATPGVRLAPESEAPVTPAPNALADAAAREAAFKEAAEPAPVGLKPEGATHPVAGQRPAAPVGENEGIPLAPEGTEHPAAKEGSLFSRLSAEKAELEKAPESAAPAPATPPAKAKGSVFAAARTVKAMLGWDGSAADLRRAKASEESDIHRSVTSLQSAANVAKDKGLDLEKNPQATIDWVNSVEKTGKSNIPELQEAADYHNRINKDNLARMKALGVNTDAMNEHYIRYLGLQDDPAAARFIKGSGLAGNENFMRERKSTDVGDFLQRAKAAGLKIPFTNPVEMMQAGDASVARSLAAREMLNKWKDEGTAKALKEGDEIPAGWEVLPDKMRSDPLIANKGEQIVVPEGTATSLENRLGGSRDKGAAKLALNISRSTRYLADTVQSTRAFRGQVQWSVAQALRGVGEGLTGDFTGAGKHFGAAVPSLIDGWKALHRSVEKMRDDPTVAPVPDLLERIMKEGGLRGGTKEAPAFGQSLFQKATKAVKTYNPISAFYNHVALPLKAGAAMDLIPLADHLAEKHGWTPEQKTDYLQSSVQSLDKMFGHHGDVNTKSPGLNNLMNAISPVLRYHTDAGFQGLQALGDALKGKGRTGAVPEAAGMLIGHLLTTGVTAAVMTAASGGTPQWPKDAIDYFFPKTGKKNANGTDERLAETDAVTPLIETIYRASQGRGWDAMKNALDPDFVTVAEALSNRDYKGNIIGGLDQRAWHALSGAATLAPDPKGVVHMAKSILAGKDLGETAVEAAGARRAPQDIGRSAAENEAVERIRDRHEPLQPEEADKQEQLSDIAARMKNGDATAINDLHAGVKQGTFTPADMGSVFKRQHGVQGLGGMLENKNLQPDDYEAIWNAMSDEEKDQYRGIVRHRSKGKVGVK